MQEFPKMMFIGKTTKHQHFIAENAVQEESLRESGYVDFAELGDEQSNVAGGGVQIGDTTSAVGTTVSAEQFDQVSETLEQTELQLSVAQNERDQFKAENDDLKAQLHQALEDKAQLQGVIDSFQPEPPKEQVADAINVNTLTVEQLRAMLDEKGVKYLSKDTKTDLIGLLRANSNG